MEPGARDTVQTLSTLIQVIAVVVGVVVSVLSFNEARKKEADARALEAQKYANERADEDYHRRIEAAKPFLEIRQQKYMEVIKVAGILATPDEHSPEELKAARKRFSELYFAELALVEGKDTEASMIALAESLGRNTAPTEQQKDTLHLAHVLRDSLIVAWGVDQEFVGPVNK